MLLPCLSRRAQSFARVLALSWADLPCQCLRPVLDEFQRSSFRTAVRFQSGNVIPLRKQLKDEAKAKKAVSFSRAGGEKRAREKDARLREYELTVGIEIHAQLNTARKLFSFASTSTNAPPNRHVVPFDLSVPGSLPVFQKATLIPALRAAIALKCGIQLTSRFDRKHYFYHDQPAGYQITQYYEPFAKDGSVTLMAHDGLGAADGEEVTIAIKQIQMEQDTAKSQEQDDEMTLLDFNRVGHPLIEIISLPQIHSPEAAAAYVKKVQAILFSVDAVTTGMEMGGLRADVNVSVRRKDAGPGKHAYSGVSGLGQRTEIKNLSSFKGVEDAIKAERDRQIDVLEAGGAVEGETRGWSLARPNETRRLRGKEGEEDYRYMPDPDIPPLIISHEIVHHLQKTLPKLPDDMLAMLTDSEQYGLPLTDAKILLSIDDGERLDYFQDVVDALRLRRYFQKMHDALQQRLDEEASQKIDRSLGKNAANWVLHELGALLTSREMAWAENKVSSGVLADIVDQLIHHNITGRTAKQILKMVFDGDQRSVEAIIAAEGLAFRPLSEAEYEVLATEVMDNHPDIVQQIRAKGQTGKVMFLVGQMMRQRDDGRIEAQKAEKKLRELVVDKAL